MDQILQSILSLIRVNGLLAMFGGGFIEQIIVPIPSPIITMAGGAILVTHNSFSLSTLLEIFTKVSLPYSVGATLGTSLVFFVAYFGGKPIIDRFGKYIGVSWKLIEKIRSDFKKTINDEIFVFISCIIPVVPVSLVSAFCGGFKFRPAKFYPTIFLALLVRSAILGFIGFQMGEAFTGLAHGLDQIESIMTVAGALVILGFLFVKREKWLKHNT
jgi:membrane protein DedA with SNARE-associated domain